MSNQHMSGYASPLPCIMLVDTKSHSCATDTNHSSRFTQPPNNQIKCIFCCLPVSTNTNSLLNFISNSLPATEMSHPLLSAGCWGQRRALPQPVQRRLISGQQLAVQQHQHLCNLHAPRQVLAFWTTSNQAQSISFHQDPALGGTTSFLHQNDIRCPVINPASRLPWCPVHIDLARSPVDSDATDPQVVKVGDCHVWATK